jgi:hypothetical protein
MQQVLQLLPLCLRSTLCSVLLLQRPRVEHPHASHRCRSSLLETTRHQVLFVL